ncbi:hypothetical protein ACFX2H_013185 [Malus domestica]
MSTVVFPTLSQIGINLKELGLFAVFKDATEHIGQVFKRVKKIQLKRAYEIENWYATLSLCWILMFRFCCSVDFIVF